jgi:CRISPR/Cas system-associated exonuclease Cas4 (RecB family)
MPIPSRKRRKQRPMVERKNEFSWSKTRDEVFRTCPRQYWFAYYGYWNGWLEDAPERVRRIYVLKQLKNRHAWAGEKVHECIQRSLNNVRRGIRVLPVEEVISITLDQMRSEFRSSRSRHYVRNPKTCALFEHEYDSDVTDGEWREAAAHVEACLRTFYTSDIYHGLKSLDKTEWLEVEEFSSFLFDSAKVNVVIDCAIKEGEDLVIYDWKTGKTSSENISLQLCCYALYAVEKWDIPLNRLRMIKFNLSANKAAEFSVSPRQVEEIKSYIRGSIKDMQSLLTDPGNNLPKPYEDFTLTGDERISLRCNFRKVCKP